MKSIYQKQVDAFKRQAKYDELTLGQKLAKAMGDKEIVRLKRLLQKHGDIIFKTGDKGNYKQSSQN